MTKSLNGKIFVLDDNIDTDQIIPAEYLTLVPSKPDEYDKLGTYALCGLPDRYGRFMEPEAIVELQTIQVPTYMYRPVYHPIYLAIFT